jgi:hypothetical protein
MEWYLPIDSIRLVLLRHSNVIRVWMRGIRGPLMFLSCIQSEWRFSAQFRSSRLLRGWAKHRSPTCAPGPGRNVADLESEFSCPVAQLDSLGGRA